MKKHIVNQLLFVLAILGLWSCGNSVKTSNRTPVFLPDAENIARQTGGFYLRSAYVQLTKGEENGQKRLRFDIVNRPERLHVFLKDQDFDEIDVESGQFEVLYLQHALILNNPLTREQNTFEVNNDGLVKVRELMVEGYLTRPAVPAIGIAAYGHSTLTQK